MRRLAGLLGAALVLGAAPVPEYQIDQTRYFASAAAEASSRTMLTARARAFIASPTPRTAHAMRLWLAEYDALLVKLERHDIYVYLRAEEDDRDIADAQADDALGTLEDRLTARVADATAQLGPATVASFAQRAELARYQFLLADSLARGSHRLSAAQSQAVDRAVTPVLAAAATSYKRLRKSSDTIAAHQEAYAALLISIAAARNGVARLRGFSGAAQASYFDKGLTVDSVQRALAAVAASPAHARYRSVAEAAPKATYSPPPFGISAAIPVVLAAERRMGDEYAGAFAALLGARNGRLEICTDEHCDITGF